MTLTFDTVLIANRGEVALRIARACKVLGLASVGLYAEGDDAQRHLALVDRAICIGPAAPGKSYLDKERVLRAARLTGAQAIHPGYGFLSENAAFAQAVAEAGLTLIGPPAAIIRAMGDKIEARRQMMAAGVPCLPGTEGALPEDMAQAHALCEAVGYPLIVKASGGGGGRGMRVVNSPAELDSAIQTARQEAVHAFANGDLYAERFLTTPRHIEIQVLADQMGHALWLSDRDCSVQRRHQKLVEEAPAHGISRAAVAELGQHCVAACQRMGYVGAGTFEFLYEDGRFYFIEMNTRLQVEHPVTEMVTGIDIVAEQIRVAGGLPLSISQDQITLDGHSIECRINAEDPQKFIPSPGKITRWRPPGGPGVRVESHLYEGYTIPPSYDSLIAKLVVHGATRADAIARMKAALGEMEIGGVLTTIPLHQRLMDESAFKSADISVHYLEKLLSRDDGGSNGQ
ncbi:acetyl-CoA carboxylase biotin carboxylase subunit [Acetobacter sp. TBRC 12305]|uniref:Biotin carboxylase n=1 Tax=Acetobacter garciniae TaxID=2817435 RepID=A0A939HQJ8_9PROT|nr:acetyl-CoA carboxylase biotin carboxylase subunit [Acetobacter garciniae]MBO1325774.1 acetyl-CoA carboxylase biotin carboxylase subunit [Acetobacter garciniae]MBX0345674.1 acetyl-CoA carboxylase biotin carboxylase subunit [Acetobacter garciniae]